MTFSDQKFSDRYRPGGMGDEAEAIFEEVYPRGKAPFGLRRPQISLAAVPAYIRYMPDFLTSHGLVEVQGFGWDQTAKFKDAKVDAITEWFTEEFPVTWFFWDKKNKRFGYAPHRAVLIALAREGVAGAFDGGKNPFRSLKADRLPVDEWKAYEPKASRGEP